MATIDTIKCISISYKNADKNIRGRLTFDNNTAERFMQSAVSGLITECVLLSTCNRTEVYFCTHDAKDDGRKSVEELLSDFCGIPSEKLSEYIRFYQGLNALRHLYRVANGIESMVIGEDEILGQIKNAYMTAKAAGTVSYMLNLAFQGGVSCAKKIKTDTLISKTAVSTATLAANEAAKISDSVSVLVIGGTGKIGSTVIKNLLSHKNVKIYATARSHNRDFMTKFSSTKICTVDYNSRYEYINKCDCVISATVSPHYTVRLDSVRKNCTEKRNRLFIDLAVPSDIEPSVSYLDGADYIGIDRFEELARENNELKLDSISAAKEIIDSHLQELEKELALHDFFPKMQSVKSAAEKMGFEKMIYSMRDSMTAGGFTELLDAMKELEEK